MRLKQRTTPWYLYRHFGRKICQPNKDLLIKSFKVRTHEGSSRSDMSQVKSARVDQAKPLSRGQNFVPANSCMNSNWHLAWFRIPALCCRGRTVSSRHLRVNRSCNMSQCRSLRTTNLRALFYSKQYLDSLPLPPFSLLKLVNLVNKSPRQSLFFLTKGTRSYDIFARLEA